MPSKWLLTKLHKYLVRHWFLYPCNSNPIKPSLKRELLLDWKKANWKVGNIYPEVYHNSECLPVLYSPFQIWRNVVDLWRECSQHHLGLCGQSENIGRVRQNSPVCRDKLQCDWWLSFFWIFYGCWFVY